MRKEWDKVAGDARRVLEGNRQRGVSAWGGQRYDFVCPSPTTYPFQWFWDSAFHAIALLHVDPELAKQEIRCLMQGARPDGFIPHMLLWEKSAHDAALREYSITLADPFYTATIQPPVVARAVLRIYQATGDKEFVREVLPPIHAAALRRVRPVPCRPSAHPGARRLHLGGRHGERDLRGRTALSRESHRIRARGGRVQRSRKPGSSCARGQVLG